VRHVSQSHSGQDRTDSLWERSWRIYIYAVWRWRSWWPAVPLHSTDGTRTTGPQGASPITALTSCVYTLQVLSGYPNEACAGGELPTCFPLQERRRISKQRSFVATVLSEHVPRVSS
jgi:hypothetical protein